MLLKPQDLLLVLKLSSIQIVRSSDENALAVARQDAKKLSKKDLKKLIEKTDIPTNWTFRSLATSLGLSLSQVNASIERALQSKLMAKTSGAQKPQAIKTAVAEFLVYGAKYSFPAEIGETTRGIPTGFASAVLAKEIVGSNDLPPVWTYSGGNMRGYSASPLYKTVPMAVLQDDTLYALLALFDAIRIGRVRERTIAIEKIRALLA